ncbi:uncharacterized protein LOC105845444 isoform X2 [Hydra vulgaris]|uniref:Uncharacterized protein LOC105845444 isoform X2 n=1 Tax=Hydra vulgaris TaxID=6087 RepID=A0ABM4CCG0_HYDVU
MYKLSLLAKFGCIAIIIFQGFLLNKYLTISYNKKWWTWYIGDAFVVGVWTLILFYLHKRFKKKGIDEVDAEDPTKFPDEIKYAFFAWVIYIIFLLPRIVILFSKNPPAFRESDLFGPNFLKVSLACTPLVFLLMIFGYHNANTSQDRKVYISSLASSVTLDLFDSMDLLELLFEPSGVPKVFLILTLGFASINLFLPTMALYELYVNKFSGRVPGFSFRICYVFGYMFLVNVPNLILRSFLWHNHDADISVLIMKNVMCILIGINEIVEFLCEERPKRCDNCRYHFKVSAYKEHCKKCVIHDPKKQESNTLLVHDNL